MNEQEIKLLVIEKTEELEEKRSRKSIWQGVLATALILPLGFFAIKLFTADIAKTVALEELESQKNAWSSVMDQIAQDAIESSIKAKSALTASEQSKIKAEEASKKLLEASTNLSQTLGFKNADAVIKSLLDTADVKSALSKSTPIKIGNCTQHIGECGHGMYNQPTYYLDRVKFSCTKDQPLLTGFKFLRCGELKSNDEGLQLVATCCSLSH